MRIFTIPGRLILLLNIVFILTTHSSISVAVQEEELKILEAAAIKENKYTSKQFFPDVTFLAPPPFLSREATQEEKNALKTYAPAAYAYWLAKAKGDPGPEGYGGPPGLPGDTGQDGDPARDGDPGEQGERGPKGHRGFPGLKGETGEKGFTGPSGVPGPKGRRGDIGPKGRRGLPGEKGPEGDPGPIGGKGPQGVAGPQGQRGFQGYRGADGSPGLDGFNGAVGQKGIAGPQGEKGEQGEKGDKGDNAEIVSDEFKAHAAINNALAVLGALTPSEKIPRVISLGVGLTEGSNRIAIAVGGAARLGDKVVVKSAIARSLEYDTWRAMASINLSF